MMDRLTPGQEKHVRAIVAEMIGAALKGADQRLLEWRQDSDVRTANKAAADATSWRTR